MPVTPVRIPEVWSANWFRQWYAEVLAREIQWLFANHVVNANPHPQYQQRIEIQKDGIPVAELGTVRVINFVGAVSVVADNGTVTVTV